MPTENAETSVSSKTVKSEQSAAAFSAFVRWAERQHARPLEIRNMISRRWQHVECFRRSRREPHPVELAAAMHDFDKPEGMLR